MFSLLIFSLGLHFLERPLLTASCNYVMPDEDDDEGKKLECWSQATDMMDNSPTVPGGAAILKWDLILFFCHNFDSILIKKRWSFAYLRWSQIDLIEHPFLRLNDAGEWVWRGILDHDGTKLSQVASLTTMNALL